MNLPGKFSESNFPVPLNFSFSPLNKNSDSFVTKLNWECFTESNEYLPNKRKNGISLTTSTIFAQLSNKHRNLSLI